MQKFRTRNGDRFSWGWFPPAEVAAWIQANNLLRSPPIRMESFGLYSSFLGSEQAHYRLEAAYPLTYASTA